MGYSINKSDVIPYPPDALGNFFCYAYEWVDNLNFCRPASEFLSDPAPYEQLARERFLQEGWRGDGRIELMWLPPFVLGGMLANGADEYLTIAGKLWTYGLVLWHVKQDADGTSFILSPVALNMTGFGID